VLLELRVRAEHIQIPIAMAVVVVVATMAAVVDHIIIVTLWEVVVAVVAIYILLLSLVLHIPEVIVHLHLAGIQIYRLIIIYNMDMVVMNQVRPVLAS
jgi:hypothetical protein